jgi:periplasmic protein TonB
MKNNFVDGYARSLVQYAARRAPASLAERLEEEWLADFEERKSALARLRFGVGCAWATRVIAHEYLEPKVATASANGATVATSHYRGPDYSFLSRRTVAVFGIIGLHALIIYGFATGLVHKVMVTIVEPVKVVPPTPRVIDRPPPLPANPTFRQIPLVPRDAGVPKFDVENDGLQAVATVEPTQTPSLTATVPQPPPVNRVVGGPGRGFPNSDDFYPPSAIRGGITGSVTVRVCTDERGRLTGVPALVQGSGNADLDQGALRLAKAGSGRYRATLEDGQAVSSCYPFRVTFNMRNRD